MLRIRLLDSRTRIKVCFHDEQITFIGKKVQEYVQQVKKVYTGKVGCYYI